MPRFFPEPNNFMVKIRVKRVHFPWAFDKGAVLCTKPFRRVFGKWSRRPVPKDLEIIPKKCLEIKTFIARNSLILIL